VYTVYLLMEPLPHLTATGCHLSYEIIPTHSVICHPAQILDF